MYGPGCIQLGCDHPASVPNNNLAGTHYLKREQLFLLTFLFGYRNLPAKIGIWVQVVTHDGDTLLETSWYGLFVCSSQISMHTESKNKHTADKCKQQFLLK